MNLKYQISKILKGMAIGVAMIIPGVSGGTIAVLLNIYDEMINAIGNLRKDFKNSLKTLFPILIGVVIAFVAMYFPMKFALKNIPLQTVSLFAGLMIGTCPKMIAETKKNGFKKIDIISLIIPFIFVIGICFIPNMANVDLLTGMPIQNYFILFFVGILGSCALVVPGVSGSMVLLILGYYQPLFNTISQLKINFVHSMLVLMIFCVGLLVGFITIAKLMKILLKKYPRTTHYVILSFVLGSIPAIFISFNYSVITISTGVIMSSIICGIIGAICSYLFIKMVDKKRINTDGEK